MKTNKNAFTLAEVLITLAVIGVVAALTIPPLIQSYRKQVIETRLKRFYSVINQAVKLAEIDNGPVSSWQLSGDTFVEYVLPHLKLIEKSEKSNNAYNAEYVKGSYSYHSFYLSDGSLVLIKKAEYSDGKDEASKTNYVDIFFTPEPKRFDFEEFSKRTNIGKTTFFFAVRKPDNFVKPMVDGLEDTNYSKDDLMGKTNKGTESYYCNGKSGEYGMYCTALIMLNGWKIPDDYPYKF